MTVHVEARISRNALCPCGSGKKFKHCCLPGDLGPEARTVLPGGVEERIELRAAGGDSVRQPEGRTPTVVRALPFTDSRASRGGVDSGAGSRAPRGAVSSPATADRARPVGGVAGWRHAFCQLPLTSPKFLVLALAHSADFVREHGWRAGQTIAVDLEEIQYRGPAFIMLIRESAVPAEGEGELLMVVEHRDLEDRGVMLYGKGPVAAEVMQRRTEQSREIELVMHKPDGTRTDITLVRHVDWVAAHHAEAGREIFLDLADMGARGFARVLAVRACPPLPVPEKYRPGARMVTGTFRHSSGDVYDLKLAAEARPLGVTGTHPFWSVDRRGWVSAVHLRPGERLKTLRGTTHVESLTKRPHPEPVCNIEVEGEHVYRVGESGVLVHNASCPSNTTYVSLGTDPVPVSWFPTSIDRTRGIKGTIVEGALAQPPFASGFPDWWNSFTTQYPVVGATWEKGHLLGKQFGGPPTAYNLAPQYNKVNDVFQLCENRIKEALSCGDCVKFSVEVSYGSRAVVPTWFHYYAESTSLLIDDNIQNVTAPSVPVSCRRL